MYYDNIQDIKEVFDEFTRGGGASSWILVDGKGTAGYPKRGSNVLYRQGDDIHPGESWNILHGKLTSFQNRGGYAKLYVGNAENHIQFPIYFPHLNERQQGGSVGIGGAPGLGFQQALNDKMRIYELERKIEDLANQPRAGGILERVGERVLEDENFLPAATQLLTALVTRVSGQQPQGISPQGTPAIEGRHDPDGGAAGGFEERFFYTIRDGFTDEGEMREYLTKVAAFFVKNPNMAKQVIDSVVTKNQANNEE